MKCQSLFSGKNKICTHDVSFERDQFKKKIVCSPVE